MYGKELDVRIFRVNRYITFDACLKNKKNNKKKQQHLNVKADGII